MLVVALTHFYEIISEDDHRRGRLCHTFFSYRKIRKKSGELTGGRQLISIGESLIANKPA
jgi:hypothetical protein